VAGAEKFGAAVPRADDDEADAAYVGGP